MRSQWLKETGLTTRITSRPFMINHNEADTTMHAKDAPISQAKAETWRVHLSRILAKRPVMILELIVAVLALWNLGTPGLLLVGALSLWLRTGAWKRTDGKTAPWHTSLSWGILTGLVRAVSYPLLVFMITRLTGLQMDISAFETLRGDLPTFLRFLPLLWLGAAAIEELGFRAYMLNRFTDLAASRLLGIILSSVLFGLAHLENQNWFAVIDTTIGGLLYAAVYVKTGRVWPSIIAHGLFNTVAIGAIVLGLDLPIWRLLGL